MLLVVMQSSVANYLKRKGMRDMIKAEEASRVGDGMFRLRSLAHLDLDRQRVHRVRENRAVSEQADPPLRRLLQSLEGSPQKRHSAR